MNILRLGHSMFLLTSKQNKKYLIDPFFDMNPACPSEYMTPPFLSSIDAVFLTHGHFDHTNGVAKLRESNPHALIVAQYELALILMQKGFTNVFPLNFGGSISFDDVIVSMVQALHTSSYGELEGTPIYAGVSAGYVFDFVDDHTVYHSGDTGVMMDMKIIQDLYQPSIAILSASGQFTMGPKEAAYVVKHLLNVDYVIPAHTFPTEEKAAHPEILRGLIQNFPVVQFMINKDQDLKELLKDYDRTQVVILGYGEEKEF